MPLKIVIVGAGIAGLVAATSLRQAGHIVLVLETHALSTVVGAALFVNPNGGRVLARLGFDPVRAQACRPTHMDVLRGQDLKQLSRTPANVLPGHPEPGTLAVHRADLHQELLRLATMAHQASNAAWGPPVELRLGCRVRRVSDNGMGVVLDTGEEVFGDLIVGADGLHSVVRSYVAPEAGKPVHSGMAAFRFLLESDQLQADEELASLVETANGAAIMLADTSDPDNERHMMWYACHNGALQNFVGIHPSTSADTQDALEELKQAMMTEFSHFDPRVGKIISLSSHIRRWPLLIHDPLPSWVRGRVVLIGDAAHPMLPFSGQGAAQAMEDAGALGCLLKGPDSLDIENALCRFEKIRQNRVARVQILSTVRAGQESRVADKLKPYLDMTAPQAPLSLVGRYMHDFSYDVYAACELIQ